MNIQCPNPSRDGYSRLFVVMVIGGSTIVASCERQPAVPLKTPAEQQAAKSPLPPGVPETATYTVRGEITELPNPDIAGSELMVRHEAIPTFVSPTGGKGMTSMEMEFPLGPGVSLDGCRIGDKVELVFEVNYTPRIKFHVTKISRLPADTVLDYTPLKRETPGATPTGG